MSEDEALAFWATECYFVGFVVKAACDKREAKFSLLFGVKNAQKSEEWAVF